MKRIAVLLLIAVLGLTGMGCHSINKMPSRTQLEERRALVVPWNPFKEKEIIPLWKAVSNHLTYKSDGKIDHWQGPQETYQKGHGDCEDMNTLLASALLAEGYDACVVVGLTSRKLKRRYINHAWVLLKLNGKYYYLDATGLVPPNLNGCEIEKYQHWYVRYAVRPNIAS